DRLQMVYVETARSNERLQTRPDIGAALPMLASAAGKAWLSRVPDAERVAVLNQLRVANPGEFERHVSALAGAQRDLERKGYCGNNLQWRPDAYGFAVPLYRQHESLLYVFNCGVPSCDGPYKARAAELGPRLVTLAREAERLLGRRSRQRTRPTPIAAGRRGPPPPGRAHCPAHPRAPCPARATAGGAYGRPRGHRAPRRDAPAA